VNLIWPKNIGLWIHKYVRLLDVWTKIISFKFKKDKKEKFYKTENHISSFLRDEKLHFCLL